MTEADKECFEMALFDFDGDGRMDPGEEYLAFRVWEEMVGIDDEDAEDGEDEDS